MLTITPKYWNITYFRRMKNFFAIIIIMTAIVSCKPDEGETIEYPIAKILGKEFNENEKKGIKDLLNYCDGYCEHGVGKRTSTSDGETQYYSLEFSKSESLEDAKKLNLNITSSFAYIFFRNLKEEREKYDEIIVGVKYIDGSVSDEIFPFSELEIVEEKMKDVERIVEIIKKKEFDVLRPMLKDTTTIPYSVDKLISGIENVDTDLGIVKGFNPLGYRFYSTNNSNKVLHIYGSVERDNMTHNLSVDFDINSPKGEVLMISYKL